MQGGRRCVNSPFFGCGIVHVLFFYLCHFMAHCLHVWCFQCAGLECQCVATLTATIFVQRPAFPFGICAFCLWHSRFGCIIVSCLSLCMHILLKQFLQSRLVENEVTQSCLGLLSNCASVFATRCQHTNSFTLWLLVRPQHLQF